MSVSDAPWGRRVWVHRRRSTETGKLFASDRYSLLAMPIFSRWRSREDEGWESSKRRRWLYTVLVSKILKLPYCERVPTFSEAAWRAGRESALYPGASNNSRRWLGGLPKRGQVNAARENHQGKAKGGHVSLHHTEPSGRSGGVLGESVSAHETLHGDQETRRERTWEGTPRALSVARTTAIIP